MSGTSDRSPRMARVASLSSVRMPLAGGLTIASGAAVPGRLEIPRDMSLVISTIAVATLVFQTGSGVVTVNVPVDITRIELAAHATSVAITSTGTSIIWLEDFREP